MSAADAALAMPYPGLRPFEAKDQPLFFGREAQVSAMLLQLEDHRFVAVVGSSGSGKSSLVRAGLLPAVREGFLLGTTDWLTIIIKPGHQPYQRLVRALSRATCRTEGAQGLPADDDPLTPDETATLATLRRTDRGLLTALDQLAISPESRVMVVVDQFEELFAFRRAGVNRDTVASRDEAAAFVGMLIRSASEPAGRVWAILTMRSDFIGDCEAFLGLPEQISHSQFLVPALDRGQMEEAIVQPAAVEEGAFKTFTFEEGLVNRIINDAGDRPDQLPLMQHALMRTWKHAVTRYGSRRPLHRDARRLRGRRRNRNGPLAPRRRRLGRNQGRSEESGPRATSLSAALRHLAGRADHPAAAPYNRDPGVSPAQAWRRSNRSSASSSRMIATFSSSPAQPLIAESYLDISHEALLRQWRLFAGEWQEQERRDASELRRLAELASLRKQSQDVGLLPAQDLERISRWEQRVSAEWARRYVTKEEWDEALGFVEESQSEAKRKGKEEQRRKRVKFAYLVGIIVLAAMGFYFWQEMTHAHEALFQPFLRTIGSSSDVMPTVDERESLWDLATLRERESLWDLVARAFTNANVPGKVIDGWFKDDKSSVRALRRHAQGLHAAVGLDADVRKHSELTAKNCADQLTEKLEQETDPDRLSRSGSALAELAAMMEPKDAASVALRGADVLVKALEKETDADRLPRLGTALAGLATGMEPMEPKNATSFAKRGADVLVKALENPQETDPDRLSRLGTALEALAARVEPVEAGRFASSLAKLLQNQNPTETSAARLAGVGSALGAFAARMKPNDAESDATNGAQVLAKALENPQPTDTNRLWNLGKALAPLAARMESNTAARVADDVAKALENAEVTDHSRLWSLGCALTQIAVRMKPEDAGRIGMCLARALGKTQETSCGPPVEFEHCAGSVDRADETRGRGSRRGPTDHGAGGA